MRHTKNIGTAVGPKGQAVITLCKTFTITLYSGGRKAQQMATTLELAIKVAEDLSGGKVELY